MTAPSTPKPMPEADEESAPFYEAAARGEIPHRRVGRRLIFERSCMLRWLRQAAPSEETNR